MTPIADRLRYMGGSERRPPMVNTAKAAQRAALAVELADSATLEPPIAGGKAKGEKANGNANKPQAQRHITPPLAWGGIMAAHYD